MRGIAEPFSEFFASAVQFRPPFRSPVLQALANRGAADPVRWIRLARRNLGFKTRRQFRFGIRRLRGCR